MTNRELADERDRLDAAEASARNSRSVGAGIADAADHLGLWACIAFALWLLFSLVAPRPRTGVDPFGSSAFRQATDGLPQLEKEHDDDDAIGK